MKFDILNFVQMILMFLCIVSIFSYTIYSYKKYKLSINLNNIDVIKFVCYTKKLWVEDYEAYEKYGVWRFCVHF